MNAAVLVMPKARVKRARPPRQWVALEPEELTRLLDTARSHGLRTYVLILLGYRHGMRASELCDLRVDDINLADRTIVVRRLKRSDTTVQELGPDEHAALSEYLGSHPGSDLLFPSRRPVTSPAAAEGHYQRQPGAMGRQAVHAIFKLVASAAGIPTHKRHPHVLKHSLCTHLVQNGATLAVVARAAGHKSISSTMRYIEVTDAQADKARREMLTAIFG
jgi:integrase